MNNKREEVSDFLKDEYFVYWVTQSDPKADAYWKNWLEQHPDKLKQVKLAREMISSFQYQHNYQMPKDMREDMLQSLKAKQVSTYYLHKDKDNSRWYLKIAASLLILLAVGASIWFFPEPEKPAVAEAVPLVIKRSGKGEKLNVKLPDGSQVKLNANSVLIAPAKFGKDRREVKLEGEALFDVSEDPDRPFTIVSGDVQTRVLGTSFNVRAYEEEQTVEVAVVSGKVSVQGTGAEEVFLLPNEVSLYDNNSRSFSTRQQDISDLIAWSKNILIFDGDTEAEVFTKLENWFGVNIILPKQVVIQGKYSGRFYNEPLERVLEGISYAAGFDYEIRNRNDVLIYEQPLENKPAGPL